MAPRQNRGHSLLSALGLVLLLLSYTAPKLLTANRAIIIAVPVIGTCLIIRYSSSDNFAGKLLSLKPLTIVGDGRQTRDFTFVSDAVDALIAAAKGGREGEIYNVGSGRPVSVNELVRLLGSPPSVHVPKRPAEPDCTWADITKIRRDLGWEPQVSFSDGVAIMRQNMDYWRDAPVWTESTIADATSDWFKFLGSAAL